jgi:hypothetical protein
MDLSSPVNAGVSGAEGGATTREEVEKRRDHVPRGRPSRAITGGPIHDCSARISGSLALPMAPRRGSSGVVGLEATASVRPIAARRV